MKADARTLDRYWRVRIPFLRERPTFPPLAKGSGRRVLVLLAPTQADLPPVRALGRELRRRGIDIVASCECHGEVRGQRDEQLFPNLLLIEAALQRWDAVVVAGGSGALRMVEDQLARQVAGEIAKHGLAAALGLGQLTLERAAVHGFVSHDGRALAGWLAERLGVRPPTKEGALISAPA
jgi:hypothetical protein